MGWLNANAGAVQTVATIALVLATALYAYLAGRALAQAKKSAIASSDLAKQAEMAQVAAFEPLVIPYRVRYWSAQRSTALSDPERGEHFDVSLRNSGPSAAYSLRLFCLLSKGRSVGLMVGEPLEAGKAHTVAIELADFASADRTGEEPRPASVAVERPSKFLVKVSYVNIFGRLEAVETEYLLPGGSDTLCADCLMVKPPSVRGHVLSTNQPTAKSPEPNRVQWLATLPDDSCEES